MEQDDGHSQGMPVWSTEKPTTFISRGLNAYLLE